jgi:membrane protein DedA with SNARE-associated domain
VYPRKAGRVKQIHAREAPVKKSGRLRTVMIVLTVVRLAIGLIALPLAPFLYKEHFVLLVLMRPTKEVLLAGGFLLRLDKVGLVMMVAAAIPLSIFGVWQVYLLGRQHADRIASGDMPKIVRRILKPDRIRTMQRLLDTKGRRLVFLGRLAAFPSTLVAAAAGSGDMRAREFLPVDGAAGLLAIGEVIGAGYLLGHAYRSAGPWISGVGIAVLVVLAVVVGRYLRRE